MGLGRRRGVSILFALAALQGTPAAAQTACTLGPGPHPPQTIGLLPTGVTGASLPQGVFVLTYDDGPTPGTLPLAQYLSAEGIRATFFVVGGPHRDYPDPPGQPPLDVLDDVAALGHRLANHTIDHTRLDLVKAHAGHDAICRNQQVLDPFVSDGIHLFRPTGGIWPENMAQALAAYPDLARLSGPILWVVTGQGSDPWCCDITCAMTNNNTPARCLQSFVEEFAPPGGLGHGGIVLLHDYLRVGDGYPGQISATWPLEFAQLLVAYLKGQRRFLLLPIESVHELPGGQRFGRAALWSSQFSDAAGYGSDAGYYTTVRLLDLDGDGRQDVCARGAAGLWCARSTGQSLGAAALVQTQLSDANGWLPPQHSTTLQTGDIDGDSRADLCALGYDGVWCARSVSSGPALVLTSLERWLTQVNLPIDLRQNPGYYGTLRLGDIDGDGRADLCFRSVDGVWCGASSGQGFATPTLRFAGPPPLPFSDAGGWLPPQYSSTLQLADVNGDQRADVCGRGYAGLYCAVADVDGWFKDFRRWSAGATYSNFSDFDSFDVDEGYYGTLRLADVTADGRADACIRSKAGVLCARSTGIAFEPYDVWQKLDFDDSGGWLPTRYSASLHFGDVTGDGRLDACGRGYAGIFCATP